MSRYAMSRYAMLQDGGSMETWRGKVAPLLASKMPPAHVLTLQYVLK
jgi:hypothetical protein